MANPLFPFAGIPTRAPNYNVEAQAESAPNGVPEVKIRVLLLLLLSL